MEITQSLKMEMGNFTTGSQDDPIYSYFLYMGLVQLLLALTLNYFTLVVLKREDSGFEATSKLICCELLLADDLAMLNVVFVLAIRLAPGQHKVALCISGSLSFLTTFTLSFLYTCLLSLDRLLQVWRPFIYLAHVTERRVKIIILVATLLPMVDLAFLALTYPQNDMLAIDCEFRLDASRKTLWTILSYMLMMLAAGISVVMHILSLVVAFRVLAANRIAHHPPNGIRNVPVVPRQLKGIITVLILVTSTLSASFPMVVVICLGNLSQQSPVPVWALVMAFTLASVNTWAKGIIFTLTNRQYRKAAKAEMNRIKKWFKCN